MCCNNATIISCEQYGVSSHWYLHTEMELRCVVSSVPFLTVYNKSTWMTAWTCLQRSDKFRLEGQSFVPHRYVAMETINEIDNRHLVNQLNKSSSIYLMTYSSKTKSKCWCNTIKCYDRKFCNICKGFKKCFCIRI